MAHLCCALQIGRKRRTNGFAFACLFSLPPFSLSRTKLKVMLVVSEKVGGRRGKELIAPIVMEGGYAAIRRVQEARKKEILQARVCMCVYLRL